MCRRTAITVDDAAIALWILSVLIAVLPGCGQSHEAARSSAPVDRGPISDAREASADNRGRGKLISQQQAETSLARKIIYEAEISLVVEDVPTTETRITSLVKQFGGYVADASVDRTQGEQLTGQWNVRIPVDQFEAFLEAVAKLGFAERRRQTAQDVTEEFVDLEARIANKKRLEERIVELLKTSEGEIKDVIEVERELGRVRGEIEQMEGRLRYLTNRTDLTTVAIVAREEQDYVPPAAPTFTSRVQQAWNGSILSLRAFGERLVVGFVYVFPWLVVLSVLLGPLFWYLGKRRHVGHAPPDAT